MTARLAKIIAVAVMAAFFTIVAYGNVADPGANLPFVRHVMSMDTTYPGNALMYRSVTNPTVWTLCYWLIIAVEAVAGILFLAGAIRLFQVRNAPGAAFNAAKGLTIAGALAAFLVWFLGFMVVAGEWFAMWQSQTWNSQDAAFRFYVTALAVLIFVNQPDGDLSAPAKTARAAPSKRAPAKRAPAKKRPPSRRRTDQGRRRSDTE